MCDPGLAQEYARAAADHYAEADRWFGLLAQAYGDAAAALQRAVE